MARIAVCEDDRALRGLLRRALEGDGHSVVATAKGSDLLARLDPAPEVVILDIGLPDADGRDVCLALRAHGMNAPVLMLTALGGMHHKVSGFEAGADDYLAKPFDVPELLVRIRALLRRTTVAVAIDEVVLDPTSHEVRRGDAGATLTPTEFRLLGRLASVPGEVVRRQHADRRRLAARRLCQREHPGFLPAATAREARPAGSRRPRRDRAWSRLPMGLTGFRGRIVSLAVLTATLVVAVLVVLSHVLLTRATDADTRTLARTRADAVASTVQVHNGTVRLVEGTGDAFDTVAWVYADGRLIDGAAHSPMVGIVDRLGRSGRAEFLTTGHYLLYAEPLPVRGHPVTVVVTVDLAPYENSEQRSLLMSLVLGGLAVVLGGFVAYLGVSRALRVVHQMSALADEWGTMTRAGASAWDRLATSSASWLRPSTGSSTGSRTPSPTSGGSPTRSPTSCGRR